MGMGKNLVENLKFSTPRVLSELVMALSRVKNKNETKSLDSYIHLITKLLSY